MQRVEGQLPLFVFPSTINFYTDDSSSHQQVATIYNPYDFTLRFKVLSTAPRKYRVIEADGTISKGCCVDIYIKHKDVGLKNEHVRDKFRIQVFEYGQKTVIGTRDLVAVLLPTHDRGPTASEERFESMPPSSIGQRPLDAQSSITSRARSSVVSTGSGPSWVVVSMAVVCILFLTLPLHGDKQSTLPEYLYVSIHQKLIAAYILGLVTMVILRS